MVSTSLPLLRFACVASAKPVPGCDCHHVAQAVKLIEGLQGCPSLEQLWLNENEIQVIQGLNLCPQLRRLYLYSNQISCIQGLDSLHKLEVQACTPDAM